MNFHWWYVFTCTVFVGPAQTFCAHRYASIMQRLRYFVSESTWSQSSFTNEDTYVIKILHKENVTALGL